MAKALLVVILALAIGTAQGAEWIVEGHVVAVSDGDTITVLDDSKAQHKIRFAGIDAPERGQAFGERSKQSLSALVFQKRVEARCQKKDRYGREVCAVFVSLRDLGLEQIRLGMAWHYKECAQPRLAIGIASLYPCSDARLTFLAAAAPRSVWLSAAPSVPGSRFD